MRAITGELTTLRVAVFIPEVVGEIDNLLRNHAKITSDEHITSFTEYILVIAGNKANLFYSKKEQLQAYFSPKTQVLFEKIADYVKDTLYRQVVTQLGYGFFNGYNYELQDITLNNDALRITVHREEE